MSKSTKLGKLAKGGRKLADKVQHPPFLKTYIKAGQALPAPPLGPQLGSRNVQIGQFCKDFNERTKDIKEGIPLPCRISINPDRSYNIVINQPPMSFFLRMSAGLKKGAMRPGQEIAGKVTLKHIYEIAKIKSQDSCWQNESMINICKSAIACANSCGIEVVKEINSEEYAEFLEERRNLVKEQENELQEIKAAKLMRVA